jgi:cytochrome c-type biogenesis protein
MSALQSIGIFTTFSAGLISFLSPCVLPLVPGYVSYISGQTLDQRGTPSAGRPSALSGTGAAALV